MSDDIVTRLRGDLDYAVKALADETVRRLRQNKESAREIEALRTQLAEARATAIEQCAKIADGATRVGDDPLSMTIADSIRALSKTPNTEEISSVVTGREG